MAKYGTKKADNRVSAISQGVWLAFPEVDPYTSFVQHLPPGINLPFYP